MAFRRFSRRKGFRRRARPVKRATLTWVDAFRNPSRNGETLVCTPVDLNTSATKCQAQTVFGLFSANIQPSLNTASRVVTEGLKVRRVLGDLWITPVKEATVGAILNGFGSWQAAVGLVTSPVRSDGAGNQIALSPDPWDIADFAEGQWWKLWEKNSQPRIGAERLIQPCCPSISGGGGTLADGSGTIASITSQCGPCDPEGSTTYDATTVVYSGAMHFPIRWKGRKVLRSDDTLLMIVSLASIGGGAIDDIWTDGFAMWGGLRLLIEH